MHRRAAAIAGLAMILTGCGEPPQPAAITTTVKVTKTVTMTVPSPPAPPKTVMEMDGMYRVGIDIEPGTYRSDGTVAEGTDCYWVRLHSLNEVDIIDNGMSTRPQIVLIEASDKAFSTHHCQAWRKVS